MTSDHQSDDEMDAHPAIMWGAMFKRYVWKSGGEPAWVQRGPLFRTMIEAAAWGEANNSSYNDEAPRLQPYSITPTVVTATFRDPNG